MSLDSMEAPSPSAESASTPDPTDNLGRKLFAAMAIGALAFAALSFYGDVRALGRSILSLSPGPVLAAFALTSSNYALRFVRWQYYLRCVNVRVPTGRSARIFVAGFVMSVTPGKLGEVLKSWLLRESDGVPFAHTAPVVLAERLTDLIALVALAALGSAAFPNGTTAALVGGVVVGTLWLLFSVPAVGRLTLRGLERVPVARRAVPAARDAIDSLHAMLRPGPLALTSALAFFSWSLEAIALYVLLSGFPGVATSLAGAVFAYSAPTILGALAMLPGGLGLTEAGMAGALLEVGGGTISPAVAGAATIVIRLATLWWAVLLGAIALTAFRRLDLRQSANTD